MKSLFCFFQDKKWHAIIEKMPMEKSSLKDQFDHLPGGLLITDMESRAVYANLAVEKRTGFAVGEIIGKKPGQLWGGKMEKSFYQNMWRTIGTEKKAFTGTVQNAKKNGALYSENLFIAPIKDQTGETHYFAEIHPEFQNEREEEAFRKEFEAEAGNFHKNGDSLSWIFQKLQKENFGTPESATVERRYPDLVSIFSDIFVRPIEKLFTRRHEDARLISDAQKDVRKFALLYEKYYLLVREYFFRRLSNDIETAEDLTQEVFARALRYLPGFRLANASYYTYLLRISHNLLINYYRKHSYFTFSSQQSVLEDIPSLEREPSQESIKGMLGELTEKEREIMLLKYEHGLKVREIAQRVGKSENAVKLILSRTRKKIKKQLSK